jgi:hypothetical protein
MALARSVAGLAMPDIPDAETPTEDDEEPTTRAG